ncbi:isochorismatase family protein [Streptomyces sp. 4N509B]|uniref:isochorismatase family protein n=1 Tax=Streptomyces sp. 4N509B TaxID=3457413 RepID=UPI003FD3144D
MTRGWDRFLTERDQKVFAKAGYGARAGFGRRPVLMVIDVNRNFCGDRPLPILESLDTWRNTCGEEAWEAIPHIQRLLRAARARRIPAVYSTMATARPDGWDRGRWPDKNRRGREDHTVHREDGDAIVAEVAPVDTDIVIAKAKPSVFHGTLLASYLTDLGADSLIVTGTTTSGCVRATVVDAFSHNYRVAVVEEATFDRGQASHWMSLFDLDQKYADVVGTEETVAHLESLPDDLFTARMPSLASSPAPDGGDSGGDGGGTGEPR